MKKSDIRVGATYRNRGKGTTQRKVLRIGPECQPRRRFSDAWPQDEPGVEYVNVLDNWSSEPRYLWLDSFASWAGSEVKE